MHDISGILIIKNIIFILDLNIINEEDNLKEILNYFAR